MAKQKLSQETKNALKEADAIRESLEPKKQKSAPKQNSLPPQPEKGSPEASQKGQEDGVVNSSSQENIQKTQTQETKNQEKNS